MRRTPGARRPDGVHRQQEHLIHKPPYSLLRLAWAGPLTIAVAVFFSFSFYEFTRFLGEQYLIPIGTGTSVLIPMPALMPVIATLVPGLIAVIFFGILVRFSQVPVTIFLSVAIAALVLSIGGPVYIPDAALHTRLLLIIMQLLAGILITGGILWLSHNKTR